ncbi:MAG: hypothetical protein M3068_01320 [Gemmatimonadota bacterium]|nr:hypothetical protein [Gemmatimonadota bacterium]
MSGVAELLIPTIRWEAATGFDGEQDRIARALALGVGGFVLFGGPEAEVRSLTKDLRQRSKVPLLIGAELERGAAQQFPGTTGMPPLAALAALDDRNIVARAAKMTAREARTIGVNWNLAPVCDLAHAVPGAGPGTRELGSNPQRVGDLASGWIEECQREGVLACAKHFPGHGRVEPPARRGGTSVGVARSTLFESDLVPFRSAIASRVASIMTAHVSYPALDATRLPASISTQMQRYLLREKLGFDGLIVSDALATPWMVDPEGEAVAAIRCLDAGTDLLLFPRDLEGIIAALEEAVRDGPLDDDRVTQSRRRRQKWAQWAAPPTDYRRVTGSDVAWASQLSERVVRVVRGQAARVPGHADLVVVPDGAALADPGAAEPFVAALRQGGATVSASGDPAPACAVTIALLFASTTSADGQAPYPEGCCDAARRACAAARRAGREAVVMQLGPPDPLDTLEECAGVVCAWSADAWMQSAAARWLLRGG